MKKTKLASAFVFGRSPLLSLAELEKSLKRQNLDPNWLAAGKNGAILHNLELKNPQDFINQLGGCVRIVEILDRITLKTPQDFNTPLTEILQADVLVRDYLDKTSKSKIIFGFSSFFLDQTPKKIQKDVTAFLQNRAKKIKKDLKSRNRSSRYIQTVKKTASLSSVQLRKQGVFDEKDNKNGLEWCLFFNDGEVYVGRTVAVQDFEAYSKRDYGRPHRDPQTGMLPPKVAQVMLNLAQQPSGSKIYDPYCGLGTVLQEGLLLGYEVLGSDKNTKLVDKTKENLAWLQENYNSQINTEFSVAIGDARKMDQKLQKESIDAIVTESFLGPAYSQLPSSKNIDDNFRKINRLHVQALTALRSVLKPSGTVVIVLPFYKNPRNNREVVLYPYLDNILEVGYSIRQPITKVLQELSSVFPTQQGTLLYARPQQIVGREILILEKN